jgi:hypothetical protein
MKFANQLKQQLATTSFGVTLMAQLVQPIGAAETAEFVPYRLEKNETVSEALAQKGLAPLYGRGRWQSKVLKLNRLTEESARELRTGDLILLPLVNNPTGAEYLSRQEVENLYISKQAHADTISRLMAAPADRSGVSVANAKSLLFRPKRHYVDTTVEFSYGEGKVGDGGKFDQEQSYALAMAYRYQDLLDEKKWKINAGAKARLQTRQGLKVEQEPTLRASYAPNYRAQLFGESLFVPWRTSAQVLTEFERYSVLGFNANRYAINEVRSLKVGARLAWEYPLASYTFDLSLEHMRSVDSQASGLTAGANFTGSSEDYRSRLELGFNSSLGYRFGVFADSLSYPLERHQENQVGLLAGILF